MAEADDNQTISQLENLETRSNKNEQHNDIDNIDKNGQNEVDSSDKNERQNEVDSSDKNEQQNEVDSSDKNEHRNQNEADTTDNLVTEKETSKTLEAEEITEETTKEEESVEQETEKQPIVRVEDIKTAPADYRFPTTNQTRHCFTRYIEYHKCIAAKGEGASECDKFAKYYRSLCPGEWIDRWNEQRENGTFPGPL
eukprot:TRINITY_DN14143_c0_g1_i1.p1 TRINITY_DN14143_c0_g1~~TRINITY_DN14143_c0_g1_i1.p1  ORF type:complete len:197 (+),score=52.36 TRINITY_DN14143_c0_g1_i1:112-702(+)